MYIQPMHDYLNVQTGLSDYKVCIRMIWQCLWSCKGVYPQRSAHG